MMPRIGDLEIERELAFAQPKLTKAAAVLATVHDLFDELVQLKYPGRSKDSCILTATAAREFLRRIGFTDAICLPVYAMVRAFRDGKDVWSAGVGDHAAVAKHVAGQQTMPRPDVARHGPSGLGWNGHLVTVVPSANAFIDLTVYQLARPQWWPSLPGMVVASMDPPEHAIELLPGMLRLGALGGTEDDGTEVVAAWLAQPWNNAWKQAPDARKDFTRPVVAALHQRFGKWRD